MHGKKPSGHESLSLYICAQPLSTYFIGIFLKFQILMVRGLQEPNSKKVGNIISKNAYIFTCIY